MEQEARQTPLKTPEERIETLEKEVEQLKNSFAGSWQNFQQTFGVRFVKQGVKVGLQIVVPNKNQGNPGLISEMYQKLTKLWNRYGTDIIIARR